MSSSSARLLLVDDEVELRALLRLVLERSGYQVVGEASDGETAVDAAAAFSPDAIVMDLNMPGMNGIEATRLIKQARPEVPVIFYSAYEDQSLQAAALEAGASAWIAKGGGAGELMDALARVLGSNPG